MARRVLVFGATCASSMVMCVPGCLPDPRSDFPWPSADHHRSLTCHYTLLPYPPTIHFTIHCLMILRNGFILVVGNCRIRSNITAYSSDSGNASNTVCERSSPWAMRMTDSIVIAANPCSMLDKCHFDIPVALDSWSRDIPSSRRRLRIRSPNASVYDVCVRLRRFQLFSRRFATKMGGSSLRYPPVSNRKSSPRRRGKCSSLWG